MKIDASYNNIELNSDINSENRAVVIAFSFRFGNKNVKKERERTTALEDEKDRVNTKN
jgi:hypothetical protein